MADEIQLGITRYDIPRWLESIGRCRIGAEIGTHHGYYSYYWLLHTNIRMLFSIDCWLPKYETTYNDAVSLLSQFGDRSVIVRKTSIEAAEEFVKDGRVQFDFVYIDACHRSSATLADIQNWSKLIRRPGVICGHDYMKEVGTIPGVQAAADQMELPIYLTREYYKSWIMLLGDSTGKICQSLLSMPSGATS